MNWEDRVEVKKGDSGESIIHNYIKGKGLIPFRPVFEGAHPFDMMVAKYGDGVNSLVMAEIKSKKRMGKMFLIGGVRTYVSGFNTKSYNTYLEYSKKYNIPVHIYFVDELEKLVYGENLSLLRENTMELYNITYFRICDMKLIQALTEEEALELEKNTNSKYTYSAVGIEALGLRQEKPTS